MAVLSEYEPRIVNRAVIEFGLSDDPFPDLGKLRSKCRAYRRAEMEIHGNHKLPASLEVQAIADKLGMVIR